jgi:CubicO group peptidase (beta-lactamase class C family)
MKGQTRKMNTTHTLVLALAIVSHAMAQSAAPPNLRFQRIDKNGDGKLSQEEFAYPYFFKQHDKDGDGMLSPAEAAEIRAVGGQAPTSPNTTDTASIPAAASDIKPRPLGDEATKVGLNPDVLAQLDIALQQAVANKEVSGVIGLIHRNGHRGYFEAFGWQDIEAQKPMPKDAIFRLQSMSKPVVAACAMSLVDAGKFTLDEPVSKHLPEWAEPKVLENGQLVPAKFAITPRMLMSHSSGLYYGTIEGGPFTGGATGRGARTTLAQHSKSLAAKPLKFHPGEGYSYGTSIDVLGRYIEAVAGKPLDEVLHQRILGPLRMTSTDFWVHPENAGRICQIYKQPRPGVLERGRDASQLTEKPTLFMGGQGLCSSTEDYERFCLMLMYRGELDGVRVLKPETVDVMFQNHLKPELGQKYGLGGAVDGEGGYSWGGANGTQFWLDRKNGLFAIFMVQTQLYRAPTYRTFKTLVNEAAGVASGRGMASLFQQRDRNGDGKLSRDEIPAALFDRLDADKDGFVTEDELKALWQKKPVKNHSNPAAAADKLPHTADVDAAVPRNKSPSSPLTRLVFTQDYFPGTRDAHGQFMGGTEAMWLAGHEGKLFAAIGYGQDRPGNDPKPGAHILRKDAPDTPWQVDHGFEPNCMRVEGLISFAFTTDLHGKPLPKPARLLIASPSELTQAGGTSAVFIRNDATGQWQRSDITGGNLGVRSFGSHVDKVTAVHHLFAGLNRGGIHRGSYDPAAPCGIRWEAQPERTATAQPSKGRRIYDYSRVLCFAECNGVLYMAARITTDEAGQPVDGGLYRRVDGPRPAWELVHRWAIDTKVLQSRFLRGLTAAPDPQGGKHQVLIANFEYPGLIARFDPTKAVVVAEQELDIKEFFNQAWTTPNAHRRGAIAAYNRFLPVADPVSGQTVWLCGAWVERLGSPNPPNNGSCYLIRHRDGRYDWGYIYDAAHPVPAGQKLTGCRDIEPSPFPGEQGRVFYFCGYDGGAGPSHNTAWIYRGSVSQQDY